MKNNLPQNTISLLKTLLENTYELEINEFKENVNNIPGPILHKLKLKTGDFFTKFLNDDFIQNEIVPQLIKDNKTLDNLPGLKKYLWYTFINSESYKNYIRETPIIDSGVFDKVTKKQYFASYGHHYEAIIQALYDAGLENAPFNIKDDYIMNKLIIFGNTFPVDTPKEVFEPYYSLEYNPINDVISYSNQIFLYPN